ncbi:MAG: hypothetical protein JST16_16685 [Bdellovibrionales bacterium]|nr:hypothetical protein [Bdellovibrionales bacterium]
MMGKGDEDTIGGFDDPVAGDESSEAHSLAQTLIKDLGLGDNLVAQDSRTLTEDFRGALQLEAAAFARVGLDLSVVVGVSGDWTLALELVTRLTNDGVDSTPAKMWKLRCLVECHRYAEALALSQTVNWESSAMIHVNYLTGQAFESLGLREQAQIRFEAVRRQNPHYRDISFRT